MLPLLLFVLNDPTGDAEAPETWLSIDSAIAELRATETAGPRLFGFIKSVVDASNGNGFEVADDDVFGTTLLAVRLGAKGKLGDVSYIAAAEISSGVARLIDAAITIPVTEQHDLTIGEFRSPTVSSALLGFTRTLFPRRTLNGVVWVQRAAGVQIDSCWGENLRTTLAVQNGGDGPGDELLTTARVSLETDGPFRQEGGFGLDAEPRAALAFFASDEGSLDDGEVYGAELLASWERWFVALEAARYGDDFVAGSLTQGNIVAANGLAGQTPSAGTVSMALSDEFELALRSEWLDDDEESWRAAIGANWYRGSATRVGAFFTHHDSGDPLLRGERFELAWILNF